MSILATLVAASFIHQPILSTGDEWKSDLPAKIRTIVDRVDAEWDTQDSGTSQTPPAQDQKTDSPPDDKDAARLRKDVEGDIEKGKKYSEEIDKEAKASTNEDMIARVKAIGSEVAELANEQQSVALWGDRRFCQFPYNFKLIEGNDVNAFSLPGGTIYVYEGLVKFAESDDELAGVFSHEISHAAFRHLATLEKEQAKLSLINIPLLIAAALSRDSKAMAGLTAAQLATQGLLSGWSVQAETSADYGAIQILSRSRYNPVGMLTFMERLEFRDRFGPQVDWGIYRTHPPSKDRARFIIGALKEFKVPIKRSAVTLTFSARSVPVDGTFELWFGSEKIHVFRGADARDRAAQATLKLNAFVDSMPQMIQVGSDGATVVGRNRPLFSVDSTDLINGNTVDQAVRDAVTSLKRIVFDLSYRLTPLSGSGSP